MIFIALNILLDKYKKICYNIDILNNLLYIWLMEIAMKKQ